ncbi:MAG: hypothetical protein KKD44_24485 [Proteobacteria bacterium]|nr:hypothetical protein [Pseudomonadota bacterium]
MIFNKLFNCSLFLLLSLSLILSGCDADYEIVLPTKDAEFIDQLPERFLIRYESIPEEITLNGIPVQHLFNYENGQAIASGETLSGYLRQGQNNIMVDAKHFGPCRYFYYDSEGPRVVILSTEIDDEVTIHGELKDPAGVYAASVNDIPLELGDNNRFEITLDLASAYTFETEDTYAQTASHCYASRETILNDAVKLKVDQYTIDQLIPSIQEALEETDLAELLVFLDAETLLDTHVGITTPSYSITEEVEICDFVLINWVCELTDQLIDYSSQTFDLLGTVALAQKPPMKTWERLIWV